MRLLGGIQREKKKRNYHNARETEGISNTWKTLSQPTLYTNT